MIDDDWRLRASCKDTQPNGAWDPFYDDDVDVQKSSALVCRDCPVRVECLRDGLDDQHGVWGGLLPDERHKLRTMLRSERSTPAREAMMLRAATQGPRSLGIETTRKARH